MTNNKRLLALLFSIVSIDWMSIGLVYPLFSSISFQEDIGFFSLTTSKACRGMWLGTLLGACPLAQFFSAPILGALSDRKGRAPLIKVALGIVSIGHFFSAYSILQKKLPLLLIGQIITGIGAGNISIANAAVADSSSNNEQARNFGIISMANGLGYAIGPFLGGHLAGRGAISFAFLGAGTLSLMNFLIAIFIFKETMPAKGSKKLISVFNFSKITRKIYHSQAIRTPIFSLFTFCIGWSFYWEFVSIVWIHKNNWSLSRIGNLYGYGAICFALSSGIFIRPILKRYAPVKILIVVLPLLSVTILFLVWETSLTFFLFLIPVQQYLLAFLFPLGASIICHRSQENEQGEMLGAVQSIESLAFALAPLLGGSLVSIGYLAPIIAGSLTILCAFFILLTSYKEKLHEVTMRFISKGKGL